MQLFTPNFMFCFKRSGIYPTWKSWVWVGSPKNVAFGSGTHSTTNQVFSFFCNTFNIRCKFETVIISIGVFAPFVIHHSHISYLQNFIYTPYLYKCQPLLGTKNEFSFLSTFKSKESTRCKMLQLVNTSIHVST